MPICFAIMDELAAVFNEGDSKVGMLFCAEDGFRYGRPLEDRFGRFTVFCLDPPVIDRETMLARAEIEFKLKKQRTYFQRRK